MRSGSSCACSIPPAGARCAADAAGMHRRGLARLPAGSAARAALRLSRLWPLRAASRATASTRTSCCSTPMPGRSPAQLRWSDVLLRLPPRSARADLSFDRRDSAPAMPKGVVVDDSFDWGDDRRPTPLGPHGDLRGACARPDHAARGHRAATSAAPSPRWPTRTVIEHLQSLGVTAIELLPIQAFLQDRFLVSRGCGTTGATPPWASSRRSRATSSRRLR